MSDYEEIQNLLARYCFAADKGTADDIADLFWDDGQVNFTGKINSGRDRMKRSFEKWITKMREPVQGLRHLIHTPHIEIDGDQARSEVYYDADGHLKKNGKLIQLRGVYRDRVEKRDGEWRFAERKISIWRSVLDDAATDSSGK